MEIKFKPCVVVLCFSYLYVLLANPQVLCNPLAYNPLLAYQSTYNPAIMSGPMLINPHFDPFSAMQSQYPMAPAIFPWPYDVGRRSWQGMLGKMNDKMPDHKDKQHERVEPIDNDEQKALDGLPMSLMEPDAPSSITERLSDSFSAFNEGVKNHFRSISENFSDTIDDIKDVWKPAEKESKKRKS